MKTNVAHEPSNQAGLVMEVHYLSAKNEETAELKVLRFATMVMFQTMMADQAPEHLKQAGFVTEQFCRFDRNAEMEKLKALKPETMGIL